MEYRPDRSFAVECDKMDPLREYRDQFFLPTLSSGEPYIYFCGNSLGLQPRKTSEYINQELEDWARLGVEGHFHARNPWMPYHELLSEKTARLVGAKPIEVVNMNTLTVNLHLMMVSFYRPSPGRYKILIEANAFPSDRYAAASQIRFHGYNPAEALLELPLREGEKIHRVEDVELFLEERGDEIALVLLGGVNYYTGQWFDMKRITHKAKEKGCLVGYDLAHAVGNVPLELNRWGVDFAVWCSYKYLNAGPGSIAGCFVHEEHAHDETLPRFAGWWGHDKSTRFLMPEEFKPIPGAEGWQLSNPAILPLAA
ncbi:MAG: kynureninase, partial [Methanobacteriota archaeon]